MIDRALCILAVGSNLLMMSAAAFGAPAHISHDQIDFSLPIFVTGLLTTGAFVWAIAKYDASRTAKILKTELRMELLVEEMEKRHKSIEATVERSESVVKEAQELLKAALKLLAALGEKPNATK